MVFVNDPKDLEYVFVTHNRDFVKSIMFRAFRPFGGNGIFLSEGEFWLRQRRLMQPAFHRSRIAAYGDTMASFAERLSDEWSDGQILDMQPQMTRLTMEIVAKTLFDADIRREAGELGPKIARAFECLNERLGSLWLLLPDTVPVPVNLRLHRAVRELDVVVYRMIAEHRATGEDRGDLLSMLLQAQDEDDGSRMTDRQVRDESMTSFVAGHETTATALTWAWYLVAQHPEVEARLVAELDAELAGRTPNAEDVPRLNYTKMIVDETLRLYPPVPGLGREALVDCELGGYTIPRGTSLILGMWTLHRDPRYFEDPDEFRPERWEDGLAERLPRFAYYPFGGGPRQCIGASFAMMEAMLVLATIAQRFHLELVPGQDLTPWVAPTVRPKHGLKMRVMRRAPSSRLS